HQSWHYGSDVDLLHRGCSRSRGNVPEPTHDESRVLIKHTAHCCRSEGGYSGQQIQAATHSVTNRKVWLGDDRSLYVSMATIPDHDGATNHGLQSQKHMRSSKLA